MGEVLVVDSFGYRVGKSGLRVVVSFSNGERLERSVFGIDTFVLGGSGSISIDALELLASYNIPVVFINRWGAFGVFHPFFMHGTVLTRREQLLAFYDWRGFELARGFVVGGLVNKSGVLRYLARSRPDGLGEYLVGVAERIDAIVEKVKGLDYKTLDEGRLALMGYEGEGARFYYDALTRVFPPELGFTGRVKRPPRDPVNALLSYGYVVLNGVVATAVAKSGLEPYAGYLHTDRSGKPSLILDLAEEFRQPIIDVIVVSMFTRNQLTEDDFEFDGRGAVLLKQSGKRKFFNRFNKRLSQVVSVGGTKTSFEGAIMRQARRVVGFLLGRVSRYEPFVFKWW